MKNILNVIADVLILVALCIAAVGHVLPWLDSQRVPHPEFEKLQVQGISGIDEFQWIHATRSGICLAWLAFFVCLSLLINWGPGMRRLLNLAMFGSAFGAMLFELMVFSALPGLKLEHANVGFGLALVATCVAVGLTLLRMLWTMPPARAPKPVLAGPAELDQPPEKKSHPF